MEQQQREAAELQKVREEQQAIALKLQQEQNALLLQQVDDLNKQVISLRSSKAASKLSSKMITPNPELDSVTFTPASQERQSETVRALASHTPSEQKTDKQEPEPIKADPTVSNPFSAICENQSAPDEKQVNQSKDDKSRTTDFSNIPSDIESLSSNNEVKTTKSDKTSVQSKTDSNPPKKESPAKNKSVKEPSTKNDSTKSEARSPSKSDRKSSVSKSKPEQPPKKLKEFKSRINQDEEELYGSGEDEYVPKRTEKQPPGPVDSKKLISKKELTQAQKKQLDSMNLGFDYDEALKLLKTVNGASKKISSRIARVSGIQAQLAHFPIESATDTQLILLKSLGLALTQTKFDEFDLASGVPLIDRAETIKQILSSFGQSNGMHSIVGCMGINEGDQTIGFHPSFACALGSCTTAAHIKLLSDDVRSIGNMLKDIANAFNLAIPVDQRLKKFYQFISSQMKIWVPFDLHVKVHDMIVPVLPLLNKTRYRYAGEVMQVKLWSKTYDAIIPLVTYRDFEINSKKSVEQFKLMRFVSIPTANVEKLKPESSGSIPVDRISKTKPKNGPKAHTTADGVTITDFGSWRKIESVIGSENVLHYFRRHDKVCKAKGCTGVKGCWNSRCPRMVKHLIASNTDVFLDENAYPPMPTISEKDEEQETGSVSSKEERQLTKNNAPQDQEFNNHQMEPSKPQPEKQVKTDQKEDAKAQKTKIFEPNIKPRAGLRRIGEHQNQEEFATHRVVTSYRIDLTSVEKIVFATGEQYCQKFKQYGLYNDDWGYAHPYPDVVVKHMEVVGAHQTRLDQALTFRLQYAILQIAFRICGKATVVHKGYSTKILDLEKSKPGHLIFSRSLKAFINTLVDGTINVDEAQMVCWGIDETTHDCVQFVNSRAKRYGLSAEALKPNGEIALSCDAILSGIEAAMGRKLATDAQKFMLLHALNARREQVYFVLRSQRIDLYDTRYQNYYEEQNGQDDDDEDEDEMGNLGRRANGQNQNGHVAGNNGYRNVTQHNNGQQRGGNNAGNQQRSIMPFAETNEGLAYMIESGDVIVPPPLRNTTEALYDPVPQFGETVRVHYIFDKDDLTISSKFTQSEKEREAAYAASKHLRSTYHQEAPLGGPKSSSLIWHPEKAVEYINPVSDMVPSQQRNSWVNAGGFFANKATKQVNATADINADIIVGVNYEEPRTYRPNFDHTSWALQNWKSILLKLRGSGAHARFQIEAYSLRCDLIAAHMLYEPIKIGERMPVKSVVKISNSAKRVKYWVLPYAAGLMASQSFPSFFAWFESENICNGANNDLKNEEAGRLYDMLNSGISTGWNNQGDSRKPTFVITGHTAEHIRWALQSARITTTWRSSDIGKPAHFLPWWGLINEPVDLQGNQIQATDEAPMQVVVLTPFHDFQSMSATVELLPGLERGQLADGSSASYWEVTDVVEYDQKFQPVFTFATPDTVLGEELHGIMNKFGKTLRFLNAVNDPDYRQNGTPFEDALAGCGQPLYDQIAVAKASSCVSLSFNIAVHYYPTVYKWVERDQKEPAPLGAFTTLDIRKSLD